jgi:DNA-binding beta-propeller fold protein YncE
MARGSADTRATYCFESVICKVGIFWREEATLATLSATTRSGIVRVKYILTFVFGYMVSVFAHVGIAVVSNENHGSFGSIDTATDAAIGELIAGSKPRGLARSKDGKSIYVSEQTKRQLLVIELASRKVVHTIALGESPEASHTSVVGRYRH